jgi:homoserine O-succinyltransferase
MALEVEPHSRGNARQERAQAGEEIVVGLINNMPDSALDATEGQFRALLGAAAAAYPVRLRCCSLSSVPRGREAQALIASRYWALDDLLESRPDALIVTGTEPKQPDLEAEPYWEELARVIEHAAQHTISSIFSCLAAHAAVLHLDGVRRQRLPAKRFGVFQQVVAADHPLMKGVGGMLATPHSRWNDLPRGALERSPYAVLSGSADCGVDAFIRQEGSLLVLFQGHPEYESRTLLKEYQRDVARFVSGEYVQYPHPPAGYFDARGNELLERFKQRLVSLPSADLLAEFPFLDLAASVTNNWSTPAVQIYRNWLDFVFQQKKNSS